MSDFESKTIRGEACFRAALQMHEVGFNPDVIVAHPGWCESLFLKDVWPSAKLGIYCEFFYHAEGADVGFNPEFPVQDPGEVCRLRLSEAIRHDDTGRLVDFFDVQGITNEVCMLLDDPVARARLGGKRLSLCRGQL